MKNKLISKTFYLRKYNKDNNGYRLDIENPIKAKSWDDAILSKYKGNTVECEYVEERSTREGIVVVTSCEIKVIK